ncbi:MAG TPA: accessory factor UbiK family protein [Rhizobiales bacterium]|nr:accessory factor UbiK family protein [Hyphomicrobiales bacterium]
MTTASTKVFDEIAKLMTNAAGAAQGARKEIDTLVKTQIERVLNDLEIVKREEFEAVKEMAAKAREENDGLAARIAELEKATKKPVRKVAKKTVKKN